MTQGIDQLPYIGESQIAEVLEWVPLIDALEEAFKAFSCGRVAQPVRQMVKVPDRNAIIAAMPAVGDSMAVKVVTVYHDNAGTHLPTHQAVIMVFDINTGSPLAVLDGRLITEMRTAAGSAAAARKLAPAKTPVLTILGSGVQGRAHVQALRAIRQFDEVRIWSRTPANAEKLADEVGGVFEPDPQRAVEGADIVACTTSATEPVVLGDWIKSGAFVSSVGWNTADGRELDDAAMSNTVIVESRDAAIDQAGNVRGSGCSIFAEIGEVYSGTATVEPGSTVIYDSVGIAIMDVAAAKLVYDRITN